MQLLLAMPSLPSIDNGWWFGALALVAVLATGWFAAYVMHRVLCRLASRSAARWDDALVERLARPLATLGVLAATWLAMPWLPLDPRAREPVHTVLVFVTTAAIVWLAWRLIDLLGGLLYSRHWATARPAARSLLSLGGRITKGLLFVIAAITALALVGVPVTSMVAGLGIGGLAIALAAQKTVENLFGTVSIGIDQPFREGDAVKIGETAGTIESIGLRSTRIRTADRTIVTIPNGALADARAETFAARDRIRFATTLALESGTTAAQVRTILTELEAILRDHPKIWPEGTAVRFQGFTEGTLTIEITAWFDLTDWDEFTRIRQEVLLQFMDVIEHHGSGLAVPTQRLMVENENPEPSRGTPGGASRDGRLPTA